MKTDMNKLCPNCEDIELVYQDDSFTHQFGIEIIRFYYCPSCDGTWDADEFEPDEEET